MLKFNEGRACDAILRAIEKRANAQRSNIAFHDEHPDPDRRVELTCNIGSELHAVEHTGIEPFPDFLRMNRESERLFDPIAASASHVIPADEYVDLHIPVGSLTNHGKKDLKKIQDSLVAFIVETAPTIPSRLPYTRYRGDAPKPVKLEGVPFEVTLHRYKATGFPARVRISHILPADYEKLRAERIMLACEKKFPKLASWKASNNARTVLILEDNDIQNTNEGLVADAFLPIAMSRNDRPDETYVITTYSDTWYAWPLLIGNDTYYDLAERAYPDYLEFDAATLTPVTAR